MSDASSRRHACQSMEQAPACAGTTGFELRFTGLFDPGRGYAFPCDARGCVDMDGLSDRARTNYLFARTVVGRDLHAPVMCCLVDCRPA